MSEPSSATPRPTTTKGVGSNLSSLPGNILAWHAAPPTTASGSTPASERGCGSKVKGGESAPPPSPSPSPGGAGVRGSLQREGIWPATTFSSGTCHGDNSRSPSGPKEPSQPPPQQQRTAAEESKGGGDRPKEEREPVAQAPLHLFNRYFDPQPKATRKPQWTPYLSPFHARPGGGGSLMASPCASPRSSAVATAAATAAMLNSPKHLACNTNQHVGGRKGRDLPGPPPWRQPSDLSQSWQELISGGCARRRNATGSHLWLTTQDCLYSLADAVLQPCLSFACEQVLLLRSTVPLVKGQSDCDSFSARVQRTRIGGKKDIAVSSIAVEGSEAKQHSVVYFGMALTSAAGEETKSAGFPMALLQMPEAGAGPATLFVGTWRVTEQDTLVQVDTLRPPQPVRVRHGPGISLRLVVRDGSFDICIDNDSDDVGEDEETAAAAAAPLPVHAGVPAPNVRLGEALAILVATGGRVSVRNVALAEGVQPPQSRVMSSIYRAAAAPQSPPPLPSPSLPSPLPSPSTAAVDEEACEFSLPPPAIPSTSSADRSTSVTREVTGETSDTHHHRQHHQRQASSSSGSESVAGQLEDSTPEDAKPLGQSEEGRGEAEAAALPLPPAAGHRCAKSTREVAVQTDVHIDPGILQHVPLLPTPKVRWEDRPLPPPPPGYLDSPSSVSSSSTSSSSREQAKDDAAAATTSPLAAPQRPFPFLRRGEHKQTTLAPEKQYTPPARRKNNKRRSHSSFYGAVGSDDDEDEDSGEREAGMDQTRRRSKNPADLLRNLPANVDAGLAEVILAEVLDRSPSVSWEDIAGVPEAKRLLKEAVLLPLLVPELFTGLVQPWRGVLLYGPPGTGKTMLAKAVAASARTTFFCVSSAVLNNKHYGESEKLVKTLFQVARLMAPSTIFFDEIDAIMSSRGGGEGSGKEHEASRRVKSEMLQQMDGVTSDGGDGSGGGARVLVLATTNRPDDLDEAIRRRLEKRIYIPLPDRESREAQVRRYAQLLHLDSEAKESGDAAGTSTASPPLDFSQIVDRTEGYSGADLAIVVRDAAMAPVRRLLDMYSTTEIALLKSRGQLQVSPVTMDDFLTAIDRVQPSVSPASLKVYEKWAATFGST